MQNSYRQETLMPTCFHTRIVEDFLGIHGFTPSILVECTLFKKRELQVRVPHLKIVSDEIVKELLLNAKIPFNEFEDYYKHL